MDKSLGNLLGPMVVFALALALLLSGCSGTMSRLSEKFEQGRKAQRSYHDGLERYQAKDYARAIPQFQRALSIQPDFDDAEAHLA